MRHIKFRGMTTKGQWVYGSLINNCDGIKHMPHTNTKTWIVESAFGNGGWFNIRKRSYVKPETVGQSTGFWDANFEEIFEGDNLDININGKTLKFTVKPRGSALVACRVGSGSEFCYLGEVSVSITGSVHDK